MGRPLKFRMSDTTLTSDVNQTLSNLLAQTNKVKAIVKNVSIVANNAWTKVNAPATPISTSGSPLSYMWGPGITNLFTGTGDGVSGFASNTVYVFRFQLDNAITLQRCSIISQNVYTMAGGIGFAIYDSNGNKVVDGGSFNPFTWTVNTVVTNTFAPITFPAGNYYFAEAGDFAGLAIPSTIFQASTGIGSPGIDQALLANAVLKLQATAANSRTSGVSGVMPATLGALTAVSDANAVSAALPLWT
jgi:hypothetical protein